MKKTCTKCHIEYPTNTDYFCRLKSGKGGLNPLCKVCKRSIVRAYRKTLRGKLQVIYSAINYRCSNPNSPDYKYYGGRGIENRFTSFYSFHGYITVGLGIDCIEKLKGLYLDRYDNDGHYEFGNLRFITPAESNKNRRKKYIKA